MGLQNRAQTHSEKPTSAPCPCRLRRPSPRGSERAFGLQLQKMLRCRAVLLLPLPLPLPLPPPPRLLSRLPHPRALSSPSSSPLPPPGMEASYKFGPYKIDAREVFHATPLSYAMVNLRPLLPGGSHTYPCSLPFHFTSDGSCLLRCCRRSHSRTHCTVAFFLAWELLEQED